MSVAKYIDDMHEIINTILPTLIESGIVCDTYDDPYFAEIDKMLDHLKGTIIQHIAVQAPQVWIKCENKEYITRKIYEMGLYNSKNIIKSFVTSVNGIYFAPDDEGKWNESTNTKLMKRYYIDLPKEEYDQLCSTAQLQGVDDIVLNIKHPVLKLVKMGVDKNVDGYQTYSYWRNYAGIDKMCEFLQKMLNADPREFTYATFEYVQALQLQVRNTRRSCYADSYSLKCNATSVEMVRSLERDIINTRMRFEKLHGILKDKMYNGQFNTGSEE